MKLEVKWIKLSSGLFDNRKIKQIRSMPDGDAIIVIWIQILCLAANTNDGGLVYFSKDIPYTDEMLATEFDRPIQTIRMAMGIFIKFNMIEVFNDILLVSNWEKYQSLDKLEKIRDQTRKRVAKHREKILLLESGNVTETLHETQGNATDIDKEEDKEEDKNNNVAFDNTTIEYQLSELLYQSILNNDDKFKKPDLSKWASHIEKLIRIDGRSVDEIKKVIQFASTNDFWKSNILSTSKLRKQFPTLVIQMKRGESNGSNQKPDESKPKYNYESTRL